MAPGVVATFPAHEKHREPDDSEYARYETDRVIELAMAFVIVADDDITFPIGGVQSNNRDVVVQMLIFDAYRFRQII